MYLTGALQLCMLLSSTLYGSFTKLRIVMQVSIRCLDWRLLQLPEGSGAIQDAPCCSHAGHLGIECCLIRRVMPDARLHHGGVLQQSRSV